jgi:hypothetical protein
MSPPKIFHSTIVVLTINRLQLEGLQVHILKCPHIDCEIIGKVLRVRALGEATRSTRTAEIMRNLVARGKCVFLQSNRLASVYGSNRDGWTFRWRSGPKEPYFQRIQIAFLERNVFVWDIYEEVAVARADTAVAIDNLARGVVEGWRLSDGVFDAVAMTGTGVCRARSIARSGTLGGRHSYKWQG